jgi:hypothetical protein
MRTADWLSRLNTTKIKENCRYSIKTNLDEGKNHGEISSKLLSYDWCFINGTVEDIQFKSSVNEQHNHSFS